MGRFWGRRGWLLALSLLLVTSGCTRRYSVRPTHLARAQAVPAAVIPALTDEREHTFIRADKIRRFDGLDGTGLQQVRARDARNFLRVTGWIPTVIGVACGTFAVPALMDDSPGSDDVALIFGVEALVHLAIGIPFLIVGYLTNGAEEPGPSPGMPALITDP